MCRTYLILSFSGYFSLIVVKVGTHQATSSCNTLRRHVAATNRSLYTREFLSKSLSPQQTFVRATSRKKSKIRLNLCDLLRRQNSVAETKICTWIHQTEYAPSDLSLGLVAQLIARPVHTEWFIAAKCCSDMSPNVYLFTRHRTNFRRAEIFDRTLRSHGTVQDFGFVHTEFWTAKCLNFRTVRVVQCELNTKTHQY